MTRLSPSMLRRTPADSLRILLLRRLLPVMLIVVAAGAITAYSIALNSATRAYDRALWDTAHSVSQHIDLSHGTPRLALSPEAEAILRTDKFDHILYGVYDLNGRAIGGEPNLPLPNPTQRRLMLRDGRIYYDGVAADPIRLAAFTTERGGHQFTVVAAETLVKRNLLVREILLGMLVPELALIVITLLLVWFGIRAGLQPLETLRAELTARSPTDLSPVEAEVPQEIRPVTQAINDLLGRLAHALNAQRHLVSDAAHQLRTPMAALQAQLELALRSLNEAQQQPFNGVNRAAFRLSHLIKQLLSLARAEPHRPGQHQIVNLDKIIRASAETCLPKAISKGIDLGFEVDSQTCVMGDALLLQEAITNLLDNALHHTPTGGMVNVGCGQAEDKVWLSVEDSGPGIPASQQERVFERFYQAPGQNEGCGLGLAIVREIVRQHGGLILAEPSERLGGARLLMSLPRLQAAASDPIH